MIDLTVTKDFIYDLKDDFTMNDGNFDFFVANLGI